MRIFFKNKITKPPPDPLLLELKCEQDTTPQPRQGPVPERWPHTDLAIVTIPRPEIHTTLASLMAGGYEGTINLMVGRPDASYLNNYLHHKRIKIVPLGEEEWQGIKQQPIGWLGCYNYWRALSVSANNLLVIEDDVIFHDNWHDKVMALSKEIEADRYADYGLTMYSQTLITTRTKRDHALFPIARFAGLQCFYYPQGVAGRLRDFFLGCLQNPKYTHQLLADNVVGRWFEYSNVPIFTPKYSLVQHIGKSSSLDSRWHDSPSFSKLEI